VGEGVDNTFSGWSTDFFIAFVMAMLALALWRRGRPRAAVITQLYMALGYVFGGFGHCCLYNRAYDDTCAIPGFYLVWIASFVFICLSGLSWMQYGQRFATQTSHRLQSFQRFTTATLILSTLVICVASVICLFTTTPSGLQDTCSDGQAPCDVVVQYAEGAFYVIWGWAWLVTGLRLRKDIRDQGSWTLSLANVLAPAALMTVGPYLLDYLFFYARLTGEDFAIL